MTSDRATEERVEAARRGDRGAFDQLVGGVQHELRAFVVSRLGPIVRQQVEPEDVVQETLLKAFESIKRFQWNGSQSLKNWLFAIAEHLIRNTSRKRTLPTGGSSLSLQSNEPSPSRAMRREERLDRLRDSLKSLSSDHRLVVELSRIEGLKIKDIAERMDRSPGAVKQLLSRALDNLREGFGDTESLNLPDRLREPGGQDDV